MKNTFKRDIIPDNDTQRLAALARYRLLDTPAEQVFDNTTDLAAAMFQASRRSIVLTAISRAILSSSSRSKGCKATSRQAHR